MPSFDVLSKVDPQVVENAINVAKKKYSIVTTSTVQKPKSTSIKRIYRTNYYGKRNAHSNRNRYYCYAGRKAGY